MDRLHSELDYMLLKSLKKQRYVCEKLFFLSFILNNEAALIPKEGENGKISCLLWEWPSPECGAEVVIPSQFNRHNCDKCCLTYYFNKPEDK